MPDFLYIGTDARTFPDSGLEVEPGQVITADDNPDSRFFDLATPAKTVEPRQTVEPEKVADDA